MRTRRSRSLAVWIVVGGLVSGGRAALADIGPPQRVECIDKSGACYIDGKLAGACVDGICRRGAVPRAESSASASPVASSQPPASAQTPSARDSNRNDGGCDVVASVAPASSAWRLLGIVALGIFLRRRR